MSAQASRWAVAETTAVRALETTAGQKLLSTLTGRSSSEILALSAEARSTVLAEYISGLPEEGASLTDKVAQSLTALASGESSGASLVNAIAKDPANAQYFQKVSARSLLSGKKGNDVIDGEIHPHSKDAIDLLNVRAQEGEVLASEVASFTAIVSNANASLGMDIFASGVKSCMKLYPSRLVSNLMRVVSGLKETSALVDTQSAFLALTTKSREVFKDTKAKAEERVCGLAGVGYKCQILNPSLCAL